MLTKPEPARSARRHSAITIAVFAALVPVGCGPGNIIPLEADLVVPAAVVFGDVFVGATVSADFAVENRGRATGVVSFTGAAPPFSFSVDTIEVLPGQQVVVNVFARPQEVGEVVREQTLVIAGVDRQLSLSMTALPLPICDDHVACTNDRFDVELFACVYAPRQGDCDDGDVCTVGDTCVEGVCYGDRITCADGVDCTVDACDPINGCVVRAVDERCDDGDACTTDRCDQVTGCESEPSEEGAPCGGVVCERALRCISGACQAVAIADDAPCDDEQLCSGEGSCAAGVCVSELGGVSHVVTDTRTFLLPSSVLDRAHEAAFVDGKLWLNQGLAGVRVAAIGSDGFDVEHTFADYASSVVKTREQTVAVFQSNGRVAVYDVSSGTPERIEQTPFYSSGVRANTIQTNGAGDLGFCTSDYFGSTGWNVIRGLGTSQPSKSTRDIVPCELTKGLVGVGDRLIFFRPPQLILAYSFDGEPLDARVPAPPYLETFSQFFRVGDFAAYVIEPVASGGALRLVHGPTLQSSLVSLPPVRRVIGSADGRIYVVTTTGHLSSLEVSSAGEIGALQSEPVLLPPETSTLALLAASDERLVLHTKTDAGLQSLLSFSLASDGSVLELLADGFATSVEAFDVGPTGSLTIFGREAITRSDVESLRRTSRARVPVTRRAPPASSPSVVFDGGFLAGSNAAQRFAFERFCGQCSSLSILPLGAGLVASDFGTAHGGEQRRVSFSGLDVEERERTLIATSARGEHLAAWDNIDHRLLLFDLALVSNTGSARRIAALAVDVPEAATGEVATHVHDGGRVTLIVKNEAVLLDFSVTPPAVVERVGLTQGGLGQTATRSFSAAWADDNMWLILVSGGGIWDSTPPTLTRVRLAGPPLPGPGFQTLESTSLDAEFGGRSAFPMRILGVADRLIYLGTIRPDGYTHGHAEVHVLRFDLSPAHPPIPLSMEAVGMAVLDDGTRLIGHTDGFTFLQPQCSN